MHHFKINDDIAQLNLEKIKHNLFHYTYTVKNIKNLMKRNEPETSPSFIASYTSFKGEIFENIIYEHLVQYAANEPLITGFILKGPYQQQTQKFYKSGLMIDSSSQIVYKSAYKDISEFDALFFTEDSLYFVEMSTSKKTESLIKRLLKKQALLKMLFPHLIIRALIVLTEGSKGISKFPSYCTVWITKDLEDDEFVKHIIFDCREKKHIFTPRNKKFIQTYKVKYEKFQYFQTLEYILEKSRSHPRFKVDLNFFKSEQLGIYFDIFSKLYIGFMSELEFIKLFPEYDLKAKDKRIIVTLEKINTKLYDLVYYIKENNGKLKRFYSAKNEIKIKDKELDGFTNAEVRFITKILKNEHELLSEDIKQLCKVGFKFV
ncbi:MAG: hypothetical protein ACNI3C_09680 [Candidatus Marinarcus sp.]|uniref:hypothetical protein n=1 Tax=Candidatus Marinarcus sp. TaxID=3100987 RepID=UPI003AFFFDF0